MPQRYPPAIFAVGRNYAEHAAEMKTTPIDKPLIFMKNPASIIADGEPIVIPSICDQPHEQVDYEGELALIVGRDCRDVSEADALDFLDAYAIANDVSARWWQKQGSGGQYSRGKSFDTFCPLSTPINRGKIADPQNLRLTPKPTGE